jgi:hypothetical protein
MPRRKKHVVAENDARRYKLTAGIPIPPPRNQPNRYPFKRMKVGDSFGFPTKEEGPVRNAIARYRTGAKSATFTIRFDRDSKERRRVWRVT